MKALSLSKWENKNAKSTCETMIAIAKIVIKPFPIAIKTSRVEVRLVMMSSNAASLRHTEKKLRNAE